MAFVKPTRKSRASEADNFMAKAMEIFRNYKDNAELWCRKRPWILYAMWQPYFIYILFMHVTNPSDYTSWFGGLNLGIHEFGHFLFAPLGRFMSIAGGSIFQCLVPILGVFMFLRQSHYYGPGVMGVWLSTNMYGVATYMADARAQQLTLVVPGRGVVKPGQGSDCHDWLNLFRSMGLLRYDTTVAFMVRIASTAIMVASIAYMCWLCYCMAFPKPEQKPKMKIQSF